MKKPTKIKPYIYTFIIISLIIIIFVLSKFLSQKRLDRQAKQGYLSKPVNVEQIEDYVHERFNNANNVNLTHDSEKSCDEYNYEYIEWPVEVDGINCHVASVEVHIYDGWAGEFSHTYYKADTDYDNFAMKKLIDNKYHLWNIDVDKIRERYNPNNIVSVEYSYSLDNYTNEEIGKIIEEIEQIREDAKEMNVEKEIFFCFKKREENIYITNDNEFENLYN